MHCKMRVLRNVYLAYIYACLQRLSNQDYLELSLIIPFHVIVPIVQLIKTLLSRVLVAEAIVPDFV